MRGKINGSCRPMQIKNPLDIVIEHVVSAFQNKLAPQKYSGARCTNLCFAFHLFIGFYRNKDGADVNAGADLSRLDLNLTQHTCWRNIITTEIQSRHLCFTPAGEG